MSTHKYGYLRLTNNIIDNTDPTKQLKIALDNISTATTRTLSVPNASTTIVGTDTSDVLTNKTITATNNNVAANGLKSATTVVTVSSATAPSSGQILTAISSTGASWQAANAAGLRTTGAAVGVSSASAPSTGQVLTATSSTTATWQAAEATALKTTGASVNVSASAAPVKGHILTATSGTAATWQVPMSGTTYLYDGSSTSISLIPLKYWYGYLVTSSGVANFEVTTNGLPGGPIIFSSLATAYMFTSCSKDVSTSITIPFSSIKSLDQASGKVVCNVQTGANTGPVVAGVSYNGMQPNLTSATVYLQIIGN